ncbi:MAG: DUF4856 domain-containing protein [Saprospiraceae bacterium]|nr:DUF4856 domain-containing protein [Saprospiraceae bacterium]
MNYLRALFLLSTILVAASSCKKDENEYPIPDSYSFENVNYSGQLQRLAMLTELKSYLQSANTPGTVLDAGRLHAMYANNAGEAGWSGSYDASKQLRDKTLEPQRALFDQLLSAIAAASASAQPAAPGQAGVATTTDGAKRYLLNEGGVELAQVIEKGLMGACFYYQSTAVYFGADKMNVDNETVTPGEGTAMQHHWDEAFGYLGVPVDFPLNTSGLYFWGNYANQRHALLGCNDKLMDAFLRGRAAINNKDYDTRDEAIAEIRENWELVAAATAISYLNVAINRYDDPAARAHALSEAVAFIYSLQFNPDKRIDNLQVASLLATIGGDSDFLQMNFYQTIPQALQTAKNTLAGYYDLQQLQDQF